MAAPVFQDGITPLNQTVFNLLGNEVNKKIDLPGGAVTNGQWLKGVGGAVVWSSIGVGDLPTGIPPANIGGGYAPNKVTVGTIAAGPPASPATNDIWIATDVDASGTCWHFRYNAAEATYKWEFIGGPPLMANVQVAEVTSAVSPTDLATSQWLTPPRTGDYDIRVAAQASNSTAGQADFIDILGYAFGHTAPAVNYGMALFGEIRSGGRPGGTAISCRFHVSGGTGTFSNRSYTMAPVRVQ